jgi:hypothetical protein
VKAAVFAGDADRMSAGSCVADAWIEECVADIHDEICDHDKERAQLDRSLTPPARE